MPPDDRIDTTVILVPAAMAHGNVISALHERCFDEPWSPFTVRQVLNMPGAFGFVAVAAETETAQPDLAGFVLARVAAGECEILSIAVNGPWRAAGLGRRLMTDAIAHARAHAAASVFLEVAEDNAIAQRLYRGLGFRAIGRRRDYYKRRNGPPMAALTYSLDLAT